MVPLLHEGEAHNGVQMKNLMDGSYKVVEDEMRAEWVLNNAKGMRMAEDVGSFWCRPRNKRREALSPSLGTPRKYETNIDIGLYHYFY